MSVGLHEENVIGYSNYDTKKKLFCIITKIIGGLIALRILRNTQHKHFRRFENNIILFPIKHEI